MTTSIERLRQFVDYKQLSERKFYIETGLPEGAFNKIKSIGSENLKKIHSRFTDLNMDWVVTGRGEMLYSNSFTNLLNEEQETYGINYKEKYFEVLEKYNNCLESKQQTA